MATSPQLPPFHSLADATGHRLYSMFGIRFRAATVTREVIVLLFSKLIGKITYNRNKIDVVPTFNKL